MECIGGPYNTGMEYVGFPPTRQTSRAHTDRNAVGLSIILLQTYFEAYLFSVTWRHKNYVQPETRIKPCFSLSAGGFKK